MYIYVVRYLAYVDGEPECGNFEVCYPDEPSARKAMLDNVEATYKDWLKSAKSGEDLKRRTMGANGESDPNPDYAGIWIEGGYNYDYHDWWIDKLEVA